MLVVGLRSCNAFEEIYGIRRKMTKREMGDGIILFFVFFFFFLEKLFGCVCAHVYCFGLVVDCVALVIQRKMGGERVDQVFIRKEEYRGEIVIKIRIFIL